MHGQFPDARMMIGGLEEKSMVATVMPADVPLFSVEIKEEAFHGAYASFFVTYPRRDY